MPYETETLSFALLQLLRAVSTASASFLSELLLSGICSTFLFWRPML
jgi:hypothetical protein